MSNVGDDEQIARLLFYPQMIRDGELQPAAFPAEELAAEKGKNGSSVDRCDLLVDRDRILCDKAHEIENPTSKRELYGFCLCESKQIRAIKKETNFAQALEIFEDKIMGNDPPKPWDHAHALIRKFDASDTKAKIRGTRDKLCKIFSAHIVQF